MNPLIQLKKATPLFLVALLIVCPELSPKAQAVSPPPDGGYPNGNTAEGAFSLLSLATGSGAGLQRVSDQLEQNKPAPGILATNQ
jgi:hypothetical protein